MAQAKNRAMMFHRSNEERRLILSAIPIGFPYTRRGVDSISSLSLIVEQTTQDPKIRWRDRKEKQTTLLLATSSPTNHNGRVKKSNQNLENTFPSVSLSSSPF